MCRITNDAESAWYTAVVTKPVKRNGILPSDINECLPNPCMNDGGCTDLVKGFDCTCPEGFNGNCCEIGRVLKELGVYSD